MLKVRYPQIWQEIVIWFYELLFLLPIKMYFSKLHINKNLFSQNYIYTKAQINTSKQKISLTAVVYRSEVCHNQMAVLINY